MIDTQGSGVPQTRRTYHQQLDSIKGDLVRMAAMVTEGIPRATQVLLDHDLGGAQAIIDGDDPLDALALETEEGVRTESVGSGDRRQVEVLPAE